MTATFGAEYALAIETAPAGDGRRDDVPKFRAGVRAA